MTNILNTRVNTTSYALAARQVLAWAQAGESRYVCAANVHMLMEAHDSPGFQKIINQADMVTPDGMPLVWMLQLKGAKGQARVYGPTLMLHVLQLAMIQHVPVGFYGGDAQILQKLVARLHERFCGLQVVYVHSPPFRTLSEHESARVAAEICQSGARILFVGLGCPKQETWMAEQRGKIPAVMLGVGAAFDFHARAKAQAPAWMQKIGLEWVFRLWQEPRRLWRRYLYNNPRFIFLSILDLVGLYRSRLP